MIYNPRHLVQLDNHSARFRAHLGPKGTNNRVLFSAPFGSGKSYFLNHFFTEKRCDFLPVTIFPVDYSVAVNQDIFELIKHDILSHVLESYSDEISLQREDVNFLVAGKTWMESKLDIVPFISAISKLSGTDGSAKIMQSLRRLFAEIKQHKKAISIDEENDIIEYLAKEVMTSGSIREIDGMTSNIKEFLNRIRLKNQEKEIVLVIEDMDRLDPEHIFRIFNVFSSHTDIKSDQNKFGFDRVIFVCDITNIRHIYQHQYGRKVDFAGYISKFYSKEIFAFDLRESLVEDLTAMYINSLSQNSNVGYSAIEKIALYDFKKNKVSQAFSLILSNMVKNNIVKIRDLTRVYPYTIEDKFITLSTSAKRYLRMYPLLMILNALKQTFSTTEDMISSLQILSNLYQADYTTNNRKGNTNSKIERDILAWAIPFVVDESKLLSQNNVEDKLAVSVTTKEGKVINCLFKKDWDGILKIEDWTMEATNLPPIKANIYYFLYLAAENSLRNGFLE